MFAKRVHGCGAIEGGRKRRVILFIHCIGLRAPRLSRFHLPVATFAALPASRGKGQPTESLPATRLRATSLHRQRVTASRPGVAVLQ